MEEHHWGSQGWKSAVEPEEEEEEGEKKEVHCVFIKSSC
jgi:hypothetical protein